MQNRHQDRKQYFLEQGETMRKHVIPYVSQILPINASISVLEIGCGEGGNLLPFADLGCKCVGVDIGLNRIKNAIKFFSDHKNSKNITFIAKDIYLADELKNQFDFIFLRDVIEHIHDQDKFMGYVKKFLKPAGKIFFGFPPWQNPFGGHQQVCNSKLMSKLPFFHLLPNFLYKGILKTFGESDNKIESLLEIKETGITIERFKRILKNHDYNIDKETFFLINPNYETKFGLKPREQSKMISSIPYFRNYFVTAFYAIVSFD